MIEVNEQERAREILARNLNAGRKLIISSAHAMRVGETCGWFSVCLSSEEYVIIHQPIRVLREASEAEYRANLPEDLPLMSDAWSFHYEMLVD